MQIAPLPDLDKLDFDCGLFHLPDLDILMFDFEFLHLLNMEIEFTAGVTSLHDMLTPPRHLIAPRVYPGIHINPFISLTCSFYICFVTNY
jgi:hypothetical protein